jgi:hypothetical protein
VHNSLFLSVCWCGVISVFWVALSVLDSERPTFAEVLGVVIKFPPEERLEERLAAVSVLVWVIAW